MKAARYEKEGNFAAAQELNNKISEANDAALVPCPACGRTFNANATERHIPIC